MICEKKLKKKFYMKSCLHFENGSHIHGYKDDDEALNQRCGKHRSNSLLRSLYQYNRMKLREFS